MTPRSTHESLESRVHRKVQARFGGGRMEKVSAQTENLASRLPYRNKGSLSVFLIDGRLA
jgi:hypothetical protein